MIERPTSDLWRNSNSIAGSQTDDREAILEQYKLYVELTDRISQRRAVANTFFLGLHTVLLAVLSGLKKNFIDPHWAIYVFAVVVCLTWALLLRSYRTLNRAKFEVIGEYEKRLPTSPFMTEWKILEQGRKPFIHVPFGALEWLVPAAFALAYILLLNFQ